jgi:hypothetical protein
VSYILAECACGSMVLPPISVFIFRAERGK